MYSSCEWLSDDLTTLGQLQLTLCIRVDIVFDHKDADCGWEMRMACTDKFGCWECSTWSKHIGPSCRNIRKAGPWLNGLASSSEILSRKLPKTSNIWKLYNYYPHYPYTQVTVYLEKAFPRNCTVKILASLDPIHFWTWQGFGLGLPPLLWLGLLVLRGLWWQAARIKWWSIVMSHRKKTKTT